MKKYRLDTPKILYVICFLLAAAWWYVLFTSKMEDPTKFLFTIFFPFIGSPYIMWVIHKEGEEPKEYYEKQYSGNLFLLWGGRIFMMIVLATMSSMAVFIVGGVFGGIYNIIIKIFY